MDKAICESINVAQADIIKCYNDIPPNREICKAKFDFYQTVQDPKKVGYWTPNDYQECLIDSGNTLNKAYCDDYYIQPIQMDDRYQCYNDIGLVDATGKPYKKDRTYCELKNPTQYIDKYKCVERLKCIDEGKAEGTSAFTSCMKKFEASKADFCKNVRGLKSGTTEYQKCQDDIKLAIRNLPIEKGADYCYLYYFWDDQYELLYECLLKQGLHKDSTYCKL